MLIHFAGFGTLTFGRGRKEEGGRPPNLHDCMPIHLPNCKCSSHSPAETPEHRQDSLTFSFQIEKPSRVMSNKPRPFYVR